jgi:hypothetical protein
MYVGRLLGIPARNQQKESPLMGKNCDNYDFEGTTVPHVFGCLYQLEYRFI